MARIERLIDQFFRLSNPLGPDEVDAIRLEDRVLYSATPMPVPQEGGGGEGPAASDYMDASEYATLLHEFEQLTAHVFAEEAGNLSASDLDSIGDSLLESNSSTAPSSDATEPSSRIEAGLEEIETALDSANDYESVEASMSASEFSLESQSRSELVFLDTGVANYEQLLADLHEQIDSGAHIQVILLDIDSDGLAVINHFFGETSEKFDAVHFLTHGTDRALKFGDTWIDFATANARQDEFALWGSALNEGADLLFYGCEIASTEDGQSLLSLFATWTGADVAASTNSIGAEGLGGDWTLEFQIGDVDSSIVVSESIQTDWHGLLNTFTVTNNANSGAGSLRQAILDANALAGADVINFAIGSAGSFQTITIDSTLNITDALTINGQSQGGAGYSGQPLIYITKTGTVNQGIYVTASNVSIQGIAIAGMTQDGILVENVSNFSIKNVALGANPTTLGQNGNGRDGLRLDNVTGAMIGSESIADRSLIAYNGGRGINVLGTSSNVSVLNTTILSNVGYELDLGGDGHTSNDSGDSDTGANGLQNYPVLTSANATQAGTRIIGSVNSTPNTTLRIEFFQTLKGTGHSSGHGGARAPMGFIEVLTDASGNASYDTTLAYWINAGDNVSATATVKFGAGSYGGTSEFAQNVTATSTGVVVVNSNTNSADGTTTSISALQNARGGDSRISLREAILAANNTANSGGLADLIAFDIWVWNQSPITLTVSGSDLAALTDSVRIDATTQVGYSGSPLIALNGSNTRSNGLVLGAGSSGSTIRGLAIQNFTAAGISIASDSNVIAGNYLGTNLQGTAAAGNSQGIFVGGQNNVIGGTGVYDRNIIAGNTTDGISLSSATNTSILGNYIGTNASGSAAIANGSSGIFASNSSGTIIGDGSVAGRNVISGNTQYGIHLDASTNTLIQGNYIGTDATGTLALANSIGIGVQNGSTNTTIGGTTLGTSNIIAFNTNEGVLISGATTTGTRILGNSIHSNGAIGINLSGGTQDAYNVTSNDTGDGDSGANHLQNFPVVTAASSSETGIQITGSLNSTANRTFRIEVFTSNVADASGYGEGKYYIGSFFVTTNGSGNATFTQTLANSFPIVGGYLTLTATDQTTNNTSEFSAAAAIASPNTAPTFSSGRGFTTLTIPGSSSSQFNKTVILPDGKILAVGKAAMSANDDILVAKFNADGSLDTSFGGGTGYFLSNMSTFSDVANDVIVLSNGKLLLVGYGGSGNMDTVLIRLNANGSVDTSFGGGYGYVASGISGHDEGISATELPNGKVLVASSDGSNFMMIQFNADGSRDSSFGTSGYTVTDMASGTDRNYDLAVQPDGKILTAGFAFSGTSFDVAVVRYNANGTLDTSFGTNGKVFTDLNSNSDDRGTTLELLPSGKFLVGGWGNANGNIDFYLLQYNANGTLDTTFGNGGKVTTAISTSGMLSDFALTMAVQADGKIVVGGYSSNNNYNFTAVRYNSNGALDTSFGTNGIADRNFGGSSDDRANSLAIQSDGKIVLVGSSTFSGSFSAAIMRLDASGALDSRFSLSNTLGGTLSYTENGAPLVLDSNAMIYDAELSNVNNFNGASITFSRNGGANSQDIFTGAGSVSSLTQGGSLVVSGITIGTVTTNSNGTLLLTFNSNATNSLVNQALQGIAYSNASDAPPGSVQINWVFSDGNTGAQGSGGAQTATGNVAINITSVNDAPSLDNSGFMQLTSITEDDFSNNGNTVAEIISSAGGDRITDPDSGALEGIAISSVSATYGKWQFNTGSGWTDVGTVSSTSALLLRDTDRIRFLPDGTRGDTGTFLFQAWDQTTGAAGNKVNSSVSGGSTAFSTQVEAAVIIVNSVNDAPVLDNTGTMSLTSITEDQTSSSGNTIASIIASAGGDRITDVDSGATEGVAITALTSGNGTWQYSLNNGSSWTNMGSVSETSALLLRSTDLVRFVPNGENGTTADFTFRAWDRTSGTAGTMVNASVTGGTTSFSTATEVATIVVTSVNDTPYDITATTLQIAENSANGSSVGTVTGQDVDSGETFTYSLVNSAGGRFAINNSGAITVANSSLIDRESAASHSITVRVTDSGGATLDKVFSITVNDVDEFDVTTPTDSNAAANSVAENAANGTVVGITATASDADATNNTITYSLDNSAGGRFTIHATTGVVTVANGSLLDYETAASHTIVVRATSADTSFSTQSFTIQLTDVNEGAVGAVSDTNATTNSVLENSTVGTLVGITANASDPDGTDTISYSLDDNAGGRFAINSSTGVVTVAGAIDRETAASYSIVVRATSSDTSFTTQTFTIQIGDVDEFDVSTPTDSDAATNQVDENVAIGTTVGVTANAFDLDATTNTITYSLTSNPNGLFQINATTGVVTTAAAINRETHGATRSITVQATSSDGSIASQVFTIAINDVDEFDVSTPTDSDAATNQVNENVAIGTTVGITANALDLDATTNTITYSLTSNPNGLFQINATTGVVTTAAAINRETHGATRSITVQATSSDGSIASQVFTIAINDVDEFDVTTPTDSNAAANSIAENAANGTVVGITATASDADATTNTITYSLDNNAGGRFTIHATTGVVTVANGSLLDYETAASHTIVVRATSADTSFSTQSFTIQLTDVNEGAVGAVSDTNATTNSVLENSTVGTLVGITANASDPDGTDTITYSLDNNAGGRFAINSTTGVVTVAGAIDRETAASYNIVVRATSSDTSFSTQSFTIQIGDVDEFDVSTPTDSDAATNQVNENVAIGTTVGVTANAFDSDATNNSITYSLTSNPDGLFQINASTGVVTTAAAIDREAHGATRSITVQATSSDGSIASQIFTIAINDVDEFDVTTPTDSNAAANSVAENATNGTVVGITATASDADATTNTITYSLDNNAGGRFTIHATTGVVTVANGSLLDYETAASHTIVVRATSADTSFSTQSFIIQLTDVNEGAVGAVSDTNVTTNSVLENSTVGTLVGITANASDPDGTDTIAYSLDDNAGGRFAINSTTGVVTVAGAIDRETAASYSIVVRATSSDTSFSTQTFTIQIGDVDEFDVSTPTDSDAATNQVDENVAIGTTVGVTANAFDLDATTNTITYSLTSNPNGLFQINTTTGVVTTAAAINRETHGATRSITVQATSSDGSVSSQVFTIAINDLDEFDVSTPTDSDAATNQVNENVVIGTTVGITANAFDLDATTNTITYSLTSNPNGLFQINSTTGVVTTAASIDRETHGASRSITVQATSSDGSVASQVFTIAINDVDEFDVTTPTDSNAAANSVAENAANGTVVGITATASDADATTNTITYSLDNNAGGRFTIHATTGVVTVANGSLLDYETAASHTIVVRATSADTSFSTQSFIIQLTDVNEGAVGAVSDSNATANSVLENSAVGTLVGITANASDPDGTDTITYSLDDNAAGRFAINSTTGVVTVAGAIDRETAASYNIVVRVTSSDTSFSTQSFTIQIGDVDEFDVSTPTDSDAAVNQVDENVVIGTTVGITANAFDLDATTSTITYSLTSNPNGLFQINSTTGVVTTAAAINRETHGATRSITVQATSSDGSIASQVFTIAINDVDEFDVSTPTDSNAAVNQVAENVAIGTTVGITASAFDSDATNNTITYSLTSNPDGLFQINAMTGVVTTAAAIDRETHGASRSITVQAISSDGSVSTQVFTIAINDVDEFDVSAPTDSNAAVNQVDENVAVGTTVGITANAFDLDATTNTITYSLTSNPNGLFQINATTGVVTTAAAINRETHGATRSITVQATSSDGSIASQVFTIAINDVDEFDVSTPTDSNAAVNQVAENVAIGTTVGITASAFDSDATNNTITYSLTSNPDGLFQIDTMTGVVTTAAAIDRETHGASRSITVQATSSDGSVSSQAFTIAINDVDEFDVSTPTDSNAAVNQVDENVAVGTTVGITANAFDPDATTNTITYSLTSNPNGLFQINTTTGVVTTAAAINRETHGATRSITVQATSSDGSVASQVFTIAINDLDEFDVSAPTDSDAGSNQVDENVAIGTSVGITASAFDLDATNNTITYSLTSNPGGLFQIDASTGVVTTAAVIDRETHGATRSITVRATSSDGSIASQSFTITINDVDEFDVITPTDSNAAVNSVAENATNGTTVGITATASDADATNNGITYSLDNNAGGRFTIHATTGIVTVANGTLLDYETATSHTIIVRATSADTSFSTQSFTIQLTDVNESVVGAVTDSDASPNFVLENSAVGTTVGISATAVDPDGTATVTYTLDNSAGGRFAIDAATGAVTVAGAINRESAASYSITVRATSSDNSFSTQTFVIQIGDVDEFDTSPVTDSNAASNGVNENAVIGTTVGITASAFDADATTNTITYSLIDNDSGRFAIHASTGVVTVAGAIDRESDGPSRSITVRATSADGSFSEQIFAIAIYDVDEFNATTPTDLDLATNQVDENVAIGTTVGITANSFDLDSTNNAITYSLTSNPGGLFQIHATTGVVTTAAAINREVHGGSRSITARATSSDGSTASQTFTIAINDINEFDVSPVVDSDPLSNRVDENAASGTVVGITASAYDADATTHAITYSLDNDADGRFAIDTVTGIVTVADGTMLDYEAMTSHSIVVRATSLDGSFTTQLFNIQLNDLNEAPIGFVTDSDTSQDYILENSAIGSEVGIQASAVDPDGTATVVYSLDSNAGGRFSINATTGIVTVAGLIDREVAASYTITVRATSSDTSFSTQSFTIQVGDEDEFNTSAINDTDTVANRVSENALVGTTVGITAWAFDGDATQNAITYSLTDDDGGRFTIDSVTGIVTVAGAIDREVDGATRGILVRATSLDGSYSERAFTIGIDDVDEFDITAIVDSNATPDRVAENAVDGTIVGISAFASDSDATNNQITYSLLDDAGGRFDIDSHTGVVTVRDGMLLDYETATSHAIVVRAESMDGSFSTRSFVIELTDVDEYAVSNPFDADTADNQVDENAAIGTYVGITAQAIDLDGTNNVVTYSLVDDDQGHFAIDSHSGNVFTAAVLDREALGATRSIVVRATSNDGSVSDRTFYVAINDLNEFGIGSITDSNLLSNHVTENATTGTPVGIIALAIDPDATNNTILYSLDDSAGGRFAIHATTGEVTVADGSLLDYESAVMHTITVRATSFDGSTTTTQFTIHLDDANEFVVSPVSDHDAAQNFVMENAAYGTVVGITAYAVDYDGTSSVSYSLDNNAGGRFHIDPATGVVTVAGSIDRESAGSLTISIRATSSDGSFSLQTFVLQVGDVNEFSTEVPTDSDGGINAVAENSAPGTTVGLTVHAIDRDATQSGITYSLLNSAGGRFAIDANTGVVTTLMPLDFEAKSSWDIQVLATSEDGSFATQSFTIQVLNAQERPVGASDTYASTYMDNLIVGGSGLLQNDHDPDGDSITAILVSGPSHGSILSWDNKGGFFYRPERLFVGTVTFVYQLFDGQLYSDPVTVTIVLSSPAANTTTSSNSTNNSSSTGTSSALTVTPTTAPASSNAPETEASAETPKAVAGDNAIATVNMVGEANSGLVALVEDSEKKGQSYSYESSSSLLSRNRLRLLDRNGLHFEVEAHRGFDDFDLSRHGYSDDRDKSMFDQEGTRVTLDSMLVNTVIGTGILLWVVQGAHIAGTLVSATPAWLNIDPLAVMPGLGNGEKKADLMSKEESLFEK